MMEWGTAAHAIALEAGMGIKAYEQGKVLSQLTYNKENLLNPFLIVE